MQIRNSDIVFTEFEQVQIGMEFFKKMGFKIYTEVPIFSASADMVIIDDDNNIEVIEFKLNNWKKAIQQVKKHSIAVDQMSICILKPKLKETQQQIERFCKQERIGLYYSADSSIEKIIISPKCNRVWEVEKERLFAFIANGDLGGEP